MIDFKNLKNYKFIASHNNDGNTSYYGLFLNTNHEKLIYFPVPKNANTSLKLFLLDHLGLLENFNINFNKKQSDLDSKEMEIVRNYFDFMPLKQRYSPIPKNQGLIRMAVIRDPLKRFISSYKNRILFHKDHHFGNLKVDEVLEILEEGHFANSHFLPQSYFLGKNPKNFDLIKDVKNIGEIEDGINKFFGQKKKIPKLQTGGNEFELELNNRQIKRIKKKKREDKEFLEKW